MTALKNASFICLDCEMTGLDPETDRIIEIGAIQFQGAEELGSMETLVDPERDVPADSMAIHHISADMLVGQPKIADLLPALFAFVDSRIIVGHGISFDLLMLEKEAGRANLPYPLKNNRCIDTLRLARHYGDSPNNSLKRLAAHFNVTSDGAHRALSDVKTNIAVFWHLVRRFHTLEEVFNILAHPIKIKYMPLGKYKGRLFSEIPLQYLQWLTKMEFDQDLTFSIRCELKKRKKGDDFGQAANPFSAL